MSDPLESHADTSGGFYQTALDTLMDGLQISSTTKLDAVHYNNTFLKHFSKVDEEKFFSFCSTIKRPNNKSDACSVTKVKDNKQINCQNSMNDNQVTTTTATPTLNIIDTPKRTIACSRKQKLFANNDATEEAEDAKEECGSYFKFKTRFTKTKKELSPQSLLLKKAIVRYECQQRRQERTALSKKPIRASLRI